MMDEKPEVVEKEDAIDIGRSRGELEFKDVCFAYKNRVDTLKNISFKVPGGSRVAVVGPTGAGKTTLVSLLVRYYDPASGVISIDGHDTKDLTLDCLRKQISLVLQEPLLFSGSIADNIRYGRLEGTMDDIVAAAKGANCHDFIEALPNGYETELGEGGHQLSGGERQRICVARAFIRDAPILILDEPTSSIDSKTESVILDALDNLMKGRTSFMIAHRLSTIRDADLIVVLNHGELVEHGTHDDLLRRRGLYYQLYEAQTGRSAKIEAEYAQAQAEGKTAEESAEIAMTAGAIAESEAADALAEATANAATAADATPPNGVPEPVVAVETPGTVEDPRTRSRSRGDRGRGPGRCSRGAPAGTPTDRLRGRDRAGDRDARERRATARAGGFGGARAPPPRGGHSAGGTTRRRPGRQRRSCKWLARRPGRPAAVHRAGWR